MAPIVSLRRVLIVFFFFLVDLQLIHCDCYYPNGDLSTDGDQPCSSESDSACCPLNWQCLSNGLCYLENEEYFGRYTCTDKTWKSESCPNICTHDDTASGNEAVLKCNSGLYCCDANRPDAADAGGGLGCCDTSKDFFALPDGESISSIGNVAAATSTIKLATQASTTESSSEVVLQPTLTESTTSSTSPTISTSPTSSPSPSTTSTTTSIASSSSASNNIGTVITPSQADTSVVLVTSVVINSAGSISSVIISTTAAPASQSTTRSSIPASTQTSSSKIIGVKIGVGVGVPVGVLALAALVFFIWRCQKNRKRFTPSSMDHSLPINCNPIDSMKSKADLGTPYTATTASPEIEQRASGKYSSMGSGPGQGEYRGVSTAALGIHPPSTELPDSPSPLSELSGNSSRQRDFSNMQMSELVGSSYHPRELP